MSGLLASLVLIGVTIGCVAVLMLLAWVGIYLISRLDDGG